MCVLRVIYCHFEHCYKLVHEETRIPTATPGEMSLWCRTAFLKFLLTLTYVHSYQAPTKLFVFEPPMHVLVTDVPSALGYEWPVHYLERRWVDKVPILQLPDWHAGVDYQEIVRWESHISLRPWYIRMDLQPPLSRVCSLDGYATWRQRYFYMFHHDILFFSTPYNGIIANGEEKLDSELSCVTRFSTDVYRHS